MPHDLLLKGGTVIDPSRSLHINSDIAFDGGTVAAIAEDISTTGATEVVDCKGKLITPGFVDLHTHVYLGSTTLGIDADKLGPHSGCTTFVDAGSAGWATYEGFRRFVADRWSARILGFVHISAIGIPDLSLAECLLPNTCRVEETAAVVERHSEVCTGVKVRMTDRLVGEHGLEPLRLAVKAAELANTRVMVHIGNTVRPVPELLDIMRPGDIITHCHTGGSNSILTGTAEGHVLDEVRAARERGIIFDVGHGAGSFNFNSGEIAIGEGFLPDVISTDIHVANINGCVRDMPTTLSKFLHLGLTIDQVIERCTLAPSRVIGRDDLGTLKIGGVGDAAVLDLEEGEFELVDAQSNTRTVNRLLRCTLTVKDGVVWRGDEGEACA